MARRQTYDPATLASTVLLLLTSGVVACWIPARRAARVESYGGAAIRIARDEGTRTERKFKPAGRNCCRLRDRLKGESLMGSGSDPGKRPNLTASRRMDRERDQADDGCVNETIQTTPLQVFRRSGFIRDLREITLL